MKILIILSSLAITNALKQGRCWESFALVKAQCHKDFSYHSEYEDDCVHKALEVYAKCRGGSKDPSELNDMGPDFVCKVEPPEGGVDFRLEKE